jgi:hypothetical protein
MCDVIESESAFRQALKRAAALREHVAAIRALRGLDAAIADWEAFISYGESEDPAADRARYLRGVL